MRVTMDIEANGLYYEATTMWCVVFRDMDTGESTQFFNGDRSTWQSPEEYLKGFPVDSLVEYLDKCTMIAAHNGIDFDIPFLEKIIGWKPKAHVEIVDTLVMSRLLDPDRTRVEGTRGPHGVEAWGKRLGRWKPDHTDWSQFSEKMLHRCTEDVEIQDMIYRYLLDEASISDVSKSIFDKSSYTSHDWSLAMLNEHKSTYIMSEQGRNGCYFDTEKAEEYTEVLTVALDEAEAEVLQYTTQKPKQKGVSILEPFKKNGSLKKTVLDWYPHLEYGFDYLEINGPVRDFEDVLGPFTRIEWNSLNLGSEKQLKEWLYTIGWEPDAWNFSKTQEDADGKPIRTSPQLTETSLSNLPYNIGANLTKRSKARHRRSQIQGWINQCREDHRVPGEANPQGTPTGRMRHRIIANVPSPNVFEDKKDKANPRNGSLIWYPEEQKTFFGTEMRSLFTCPPDKVLVGRDASGLELRCFAHYLNDPTYTDIILSGDIHSHNQEMAGLNTRAEAKTFIYAFLYGAGVEKLGSIVLPEGTSEQKKAAGTEMQNRFLSANPNLAKLVKGVKKASGRGWLKGIDGRRLHMRTFHGRVEKNKALNTLLQGAGALIMTQARVWLYEEVQKSKELSSAIKVLDYHDEETWECSPNIAEELREVMIDSVVQAGLFFDFNCPLNADARIGKTWAHIH